ncbi:GDSL esterase/lipase 7 [Linum perenne]
MGNKGLLCVSLQVWIVLFFIRSSCIAAENHVPALFIFGDSTLDAGNNNFLPTKAKANFFPYGVDHPLGTTGRFTNGRTIADFFAEWLGLEYQPPVLSIKKNGVNHTLEGLNYASGSSGILDSTGSADGENLPLRKQIELFRKNVEDDDERKRLSMSIFLFSIASNDYFLHPNKTYLLQNFETFTNNLLRKLVNEIKNIYVIGGRKFVISQLYPFGCTLKMTKYEKTTSPNQECVYMGEDLANVFNSNLAIKLNELSATLKGSTFITIKVFDLVSNLLANPTQYGIKDIKHPCAVTDSSTKELISLCKDRNSYALFDQVHPTEAIYRNIASRCLNGTGVCAPINIKQLVDKK